MKKVVLAMGAALALSISSTVVNAQTGQIGMTLPAQGVTVSVNESDSNDRLRCTLLEKRGKALPAYCNIL